MGLLKKLLLKKGNFTVARATLVIALFTLVSRLVGLVRTRMLASTFGAGQTLDIYYASFRLPDLLANILVVGTLSVAFLPVFTEYLARDRNHAYRIASTIINTTFVGMAIICGIFAIFAGPLSRLMFPGFEGEQLRQVTELTRIILASQVIFAVSNVVSSILNSYKRFFIATAAPVLYNAGIIFGLVFLYPRWGLKGLGMGVVLGALLNVGIQLPDLFASGYRWHPIISLKDSAIKKIGALFVPRMFAIDGLQVSLLVGTFIGSILPAGSITILNLAMDLQAVPIGLFGIATAIASFPLLSEYFAKQNENGFSEALAKSICQILFFLVPLSVGILLYRAFIVRLAFGAGNFTWEDTILTFNTLGVLSFGLVAQGLVPVLARAFYARHNTKIPVLINLSAVVIHATLSFLLASQYGIPGVAAGFVAASIYNCIALFIALRATLSQTENMREALHAFDETIIETLWKILLASFALGFVGYISLYAIEPLLNTRTGLGILIQSGVSALLAGIVYLGVAYRLKLAYAENLLHWILQKRRKL